MNYITFSRTEQRHPFHMVDPSPWPLTTAFAVLSMALGGVMYMHTYSMGGFTLFFGFIALVTNMYVWFRDITREATYQGHHTEVVQVGIRYGMLMFIVSEIMFFFAFFWAFFSFFFSTVC